MWHPLSAKVGNHFADKRRSLGRYIVRLRTQTMEFFFLAWRPGLSIFKQTKPLLQPKAQEANHLHGLLLADNTEAHFWGYSSVRYVTLGICCKSYHIMKGLSNISAVWSVVASGVSFGENAFRIGNSFSNRGSRGNRTRWRRMWWHKWAPW
jgi:hypothetical protein